MRKPLRVGPMDAAIIGKLKDLVAMAQAAMETAYTIEIVIIDTRYPFLSHKTPKPKRPRPLNTEIMPIAVVAIITAAASLIFFKTRIS